jgi:phosphoglycolate phosphatase-like HAD superfamily hydrolase
MLRAIVFDFDGVIHNTFEFHRQRIAKFTGHILSPEEFKGMHDGNFYNNKYGNTNWDKYKDFIADDLARLKIEPQIKESLTLLHNTYNLFIITSGGEQNILRYCIANGMSHVFTRIMGFETDKSKVKKFRMIFEEYHLSNKDTLFITDTLGDIQEASQINVPTIAVDYGYHSRKHLSEGRPIKIISEFSEINSCILELNAKNRY